RMGHPLLHRPMVWDFDPVLFHHLGPLPLEIRYYGIFFAAGLLLGASTTGKMFELHGLPREKLGRMLVWVCVTMVFGSHLIHLIFDAPPLILENPLNIFKVTSGLASHGGGLGAVLGLWLFCKREKENFFEFADAVVVGATWPITTVRIGNFFNSEIYGRVTDLPWGVIFARHGFTEPRHPSQIYEALMGAALILFSMLFYRKFHRRLRP